VGGVFDTELGPAFFSPLLEAVDEAASMDVLCSDKMGTLTLNDLEVTAVRPMAEFDAPHVLRLAAVASAEGGQDPVDKAIRTAAGSVPLSDRIVVTNFVPFDPKTKMSEATATFGPGQVEQRVIKGAFATVCRLCRINAAGVASSATSRHNSGRKSLTMFDPPIV
jgi:H+-transporting ATPase